VAWQAARAEGRALEPSEASSRLIGSIPGYA
jgi:hypothetical protein